MDSSNVLEGKSEQILIRLEKAITLYNIKVEELFKRVFFAEFF